MDAPKRIIYRAIFFAGWLLSPLTLWNDVFINIPLSYLCASLFAAFLPINFLALTVIFYWGSNLFGILLMAASGGQLFKEKGRGMLREIAIIVLTMTIYTALLLLAGALGILRPLHAITP